MNETDISTTVDTAEARVARGLAWLRTEGAALGWDVNRVQLDTMVLTDVTVCVLAQASGMYYGEALSQASGHGRWTMEGEAWAVAHGFTADGFPWSRESDWADVTAAWHAALSLAGV